MTLKNDTPLSELPQHERNQSPNWIPTYHEKVSGRDSGGKVSGEIGRLIIHTFVMERSSPQQVQKRV